MALEDVYILSNLLGACSSTADLEAAFAAYAAVRVPRTKSVTAWSRKYGMIREMEDEEIGDDLEKIAAAGEFLVSTVFPPRSCCWLSDVLTG